MTSSDLNFTMLLRLANVIADIDIRRSHEPQALTELIDIAERIVVEMKMELFDIGQLEDYVHGIRRAHAIRPNVLHIMIEAAHIDIERLLGCRAGEVYVNDEGIAA